MATKKTNKKATKKDNKKVAKKVEKQEEKHTPTFQEIYSQYAMQDIEQIERAVGMGSSMDIPYSLSSSSLVLDTIYGGGVYSGWYTLLGGEASAKSTNCISFLGECVRNHIPCYYFDGEGSIEGTYTPAICRVDSLSDLFGQKNEKGKIEKFGCARYYDDTTMEKVFGVIKERLLNLPDKKYKKEKDQWYLVFDPSRKLHLKMMSALGLKSVDKSRKQVWCPVDSGDYQAVFMLDSYPSFIPETIGEDEDKDSQGVALQAREYAKWVPQIKGLLRRKHCVVYGVNQLRDKPMVLYGKPTSEPCGNALKFFSDVRCEFSSIAVTSVKLGTWDKGDTSSEGEEDSVEVSGAVDKYQYKKVVNTKNKKGTPFRMGYQRIWFKDGNGKGRGVDPVFDTWAYLYETGQYDGDRRKKFVVNIKGFEGIEFDWLKFKKLIIAEVYGNKNLRKELKEEGIKKLNLRELCFEQIRSGEYKKFLNTVEDGDDDEEDDFESEDF